MVKEYIAKVKPPAHIQCIAEHLFNNNSNVSSNLKENANFVKHIQAQLDQMTKDVCFLPRVNTIFFFNPVIGS